MLLASRALIASLPSFWDTVRKAGKISAQFERLHGHDANSELRRIIPTAKDLLKRDFRGGISMGLLRSFGMWCARLERYRLSLNVALAAIRAYTMYARN